MDSIFVLLIGLITGIAIGIVVTWLTGKAQSKNANEIVKQQIQQKDNEIIELRKLYDVERGVRVTAEVEKKEAEKSLEAQRKTLEDAKKELSNAFGSLSKESLQSNNRVFLDLAKSTLETLVSQAKGDFGKSQEAIDGLVKPLKESLDRYEKEIQKIEVHRQEAYGSIKEQLKNVIKETSSLGTALRSPQGRGRWGEITLKRVVELAGMSEHCDFVEQESVVTTDGLLRPDMTVNLPGGRHIVIDAKVSLVAFQEAMNSSTDEERNSAFKRHAVHMRDRMKELSNKAYWEQFRDSTPELVVMFIPGESFFGAAVEIDKSLIEDGARKNVILSTPTTLIALLKAIAFGWRQEQLAKNATQIRIIGSEIHDRIVTFMKSLSRVGVSLGKTTDAYNDAVGSLERRVLVSARKLKELGTTGADDIPEVNQVEITPRQLQFINPAEEPLTENEDN